MRRLASAILTTTLLLGCSAQIREERDPPIGSETHTPPSASTTPFKERALADLRRKVKGKAALFHTDEKAEQANWTARMRVGTYYKVAVDCVGSDGYLVVRATNGLNMVSQCFAGYNTWTVDNLPRKAPRNYKLTVQAPRGAKWAILVVRLP
jgi:hypothetical protein